MISPAEPDSPQHNTLPKLVFFNRSYWPDTEATGQLLTPLSQYLTREFSLEVVAGAPNHTQVGLQQKPLRQEQHQGVSITRVRHTQFSKRSTFGRLSNLATFTLSAFGQGLRLKRPTVLVMQTDPFFLPLLGPWLKRWHRCQLVCYLQDVYPDIAIAVGKAKEGLITRTLRKFLFNAYKQADQLIVISQDMAEKCIQHGVPAEQISIVENWADCDQIKPVKVNNAFRKEHNLEDKFVVMYSGNLGMAHLLSPILDAAENLKEDERVVFLFVGEGVRKPELMKTAADRNLTNVRFLSYQPREQLAQSLSAADLQIVSMLPDTKGCVMPSKIYGVLASGTAVLALAPQGGDVAKLVETTQVGTVCPSDEPHQLTSRLTQAIQNYLDTPELAQQQGNQARRLCETDYDFPLQAQRFTDIMKRLTRSCTLPEKYSESQAISSVRS